MAIWQYSLKLIPKRDITNGDGELKEFLESEDDFCPRFSKISLEDVSLKFSKILQQGTSWSNDIALWGKEDSNCVEVLNSNDKIEEISIRIDLRQIVVEFVEALIDFSEERDLVGVLPGGEVFVLSRKNLVEKISCSEGARFLEDPEKFLSKKS